MRFAALCVLVGSSSLWGCASDAGGSGTRHAEPGAESPDLAGSPALTDDKTATRGTGGAGAGGGLNNPPPASLPTTCTTWSMQGSSKRASVADSNGMAAASRAREQLELGFAPAPNSIRREDFFNYYRIDLPAAQAQSGPNVQIQLKPRAIPNQYELFVGIQAPKSTSRVPVMLTLVVDTTPSTAGEPLARTHAIFQALGSTLQPGDWVNVVTTDATQGSLSFSVSDAAAELAEAEKLVSVRDNGDIGEALGRAYALAQQHYDPKVLNRVLLISDGAEPDSALDAVPISDIAQKGVFLAAASTAPGNVYYDRLLGKATKLGRGSYVHIDSADEAKRMFVDRFDELMGLSYDNVHMTINLPWYFRVIDEPDTQGASDGQADPQTLAPGATMAFLFKLETCSDEYVQTDTASAITAEVFYTPPGNTTELSEDATQGVSLTLNSPSAALSKAVAIRSYIDALRSVNKARVEAARTTVQDAELSNPGDTSLVEMDGLLAAHPVLHQAY